MIDSNCFNYGLMLFNLNNCKRSERNDLLSADEANEVEEQFLEHPPSFISFRKQLRKFRSGCFLLT